MKKGEIWLVDLSDSKGHEQKGERPAIVIGGANGLAVVVPCTTNVNCFKFSHTVPMEPTKENGLTEHSVALVFQLTSLDRTRFKTKIGLACKEHMDEIDELLLQFLNLST
jgi:mRNA interferase MazF